MSPALALSVLRAKPRHDLTGLYRTIDLATPILAGLGFDGERVATIETDDPFALGERLRAVVPLDGTTKPASFTAVGGKDEAARRVKAFLDTGLPEDGLRPST